MSIDEILKKIFRTAGLEVSRSLLKETDSAAARIIRAAQPYTLTSPEKLFALIQAVRYIVRNQVPGDIIECGVWKGGSMLAAVLTLQSLGAQDRKIYLLDTFEGMTRPVQADITITGQPAARIFDRLRINDQRAAWFDAPLEAVRKTLLATGYPSDNLVFVPGKVEDTLPAAAPDRIALLRLDTDFYESTRHELHTLYPRLVAGGVLIVDDYGFWMGQRKAVDEYLQGLPQVPLLNRIDNAGYIAVKL